MDNWQRNDQETTKKYEHLTFTTFCAHLQNRPYLKNKEYIYYNISDEILIVKSKF